MDRSVADVTKGKAPGTIEFDAVEQRRRLTPDNRSEPVGPERRLHVVCTVAGVRPTCAAR